MYTGVTLIKQEAIMISLLLLISKIYKAAFLILVLFATITIFMSDNTPAIVIIERSFEILFIPFIWIFNNVAFPIIEWFLSFYGYFDGGNGSQLMSNDFILVMLKLFSALIALVGIITTIGYLIINLIIFPIWTIFDKNMAGPWSLMIDPLRVVSGFAIPMMVEMGNAARMTSGNSAIRQEAINNDLADKINGKETTKQGMLDLFKSDGQPTVDSKKTKDKDKDEMEYFFD